MTRHKKEIKRVVLAYSGGLDTSIILKWLQTAYGAEVITFTADLGQGEELAPARAKAELLGVKPENIFIEDLREENAADAREMATALQIDGGETDWLLAHLSRPGALTSAERALLTFLRQEAPSLPERLAALA